MGATRQQRIVCDVMIGEKFFRTFRGNVDTHPTIDENAGCVWEPLLEDVENAVLAKWPSLSNKDYKLYLC